MVGFFGAPVLRCLWVWFGIITIITITVNDSSSLEISFRWKSALAELKWMKWANPFPTANSFTADLFREQCGKERKWRVSPVQKNRFSGKRMISWQRKTHFKFQRTTRNMHFQFPSECHSYLKVNRFFFYISQLNVLCGSKQTKKKKNHPQFSNF